jgi:ABC-type uncharacterized transport system substrate-binding protein
MNKLFVFLGLFLLVAPGITAHPHTFIDSKISFVFEGNCFKGFVIVWIIDWMTTESIILEYDLNRDRVFNEQEVKEIEEWSFSHLKEFGYHTHLHYNERLYPVEKVEDFIAYIENDRLVYRFFIPFHVEAGEDFDILRVAFFDETFYCDLALIEDNPVSIRGDSGVEMVIYVNGNNTAYPTEVVLKFRKAR